MRVDNKSDHLTVFLVIVFGVVMMGVFTVYFIIGNKFVGVMSGI